VSARERRDRPSGARPERPEVTPPAIYVSQYTAPALFGFKTERSFLEFVQAHGVPKTKAGKTVLVEAEELRGVLRRLAVTTGGDVEAEQAHDDPDAVSSADDFLARLNLRRVG
jgi:hypothetical protein